MLDRIIQNSINNKLIVLLFCGAIVGFGIFSLANLSIGAVPDITNNQVQVITTSRNLATEDVEKFLTYPVELEMANLPGVTEIRSVSKFGLSVVTVVFKDDMGTYLPRQLIAEKIKSAEEKIPAGFGNPFMGPVTTGLGEIYQYVLDVDPAYKNNYSISDLRTIQDWIVKRQLSGIPGVVEVNTWGGFLKEYQVAVNPERLRAMQLSMFDVFEALENNNSIAGGAYLEKTNKSYFIRGEGLITKLEDIESIVVANRAGIPIFIKDVAEVGFGHANRFGAITGNGEGEKVLGQVMMLKGGNTKAVINAVKNRVAEIKTALPKGVTINPFLERSELIDKTTFTIAENLVLGCLIVIFVVVLLLGNWRSGLVVASVIPLTLLFALSLMYLFDVDANLMSLGAIDFGIIIDGAVIIVEYIAYKITNQRNDLMALPKGEQQGLRDKITFQGASKMMHSAIFGQLIIIIVFIPILTLANIEGKMFKPMALVFVFALIGAMILCFTYVPVMASLFIKPTDPNKRTISTRLIKFLDRKYQPILTWALQKKKLVLASAIALFIGTALLFINMGGEFIPTLDEGDFVIQPVLPTGTSLSKTVEITTEIEKILLTFPEVEQVVTRIGAAEVPTDPMSMEESDVIIKLIPKKQWTSAKTKDELANKFKEALSIIPGIDYEFTQPIEMRFNELMTGVRADLAIKIFGEDLDVLYNKALEVQAAIEGVDGAADIIVEKVAGLPQMSVKYNRQRVAKYGVNIADLNKVLTMGFAGTSAGTVFEGEKQFDLVVRYDELHRQDIENLRMASVKLPNGGQMPLSEFAEIVYTKGPAKISRDNTKRRIVVGVNVRNRDLESVVKDVQNRVEQNVKLPAGYTVEYGGQFENLKTARARLTVAVPVALLLIFILLYFAFNSVRDALLIYSAIPMSAIGGVILLYMRGLPFSISAGVGFIALFGIAVLNGIVLLEEFKELKKSGMQNINELIKTGTRKRLRPVLLTATAAALGFLPMAISTSAGAEVQRPLATVVIGGLISATFLTLVVLPVLYAIFNRDKNADKPKFSVNTLALLLVFMLPLSSFGQEKPKKITLEDAIEIALKNNRSLQASSMRIEQNSQLVGSGWNIDKTQVFYNFDQNNIAPNNIPLRVWGINQEMQFPTIYGAQRKLLKSKVGLATQSYNIEKRILTKEVSTAYYNVLFWKLVSKNYAYLDSVYEQFSIAAENRFKHGETNYLEKLTAETKHREVSLRFKQSQESGLKAHIELNQWLQTDTSYVISLDDFTPIPLSSLDTSNHPGINYYEQSLKISEQALAVEKNYLLPDLSVTVFRGSNTGPDPNVYTGFQAGISVPLWFGANKSKIDASKTEVLIMRKEAENYKRILNAKYLGLLSDLKLYQQEIDYYNTVGNALSKEIVFHAKNAFREGEIDFLEFALLIENARNIQLTYFESLLNYNLTILEANYLTN